VWVKPNQHFSLLELMITTEIARQQVGSSSGSFFGYVTTLLQLQMLYNIEWEGKMILKG
jgi:hypothetical protein